MTSNEEPSNTSSDAVNSNNPDKFEWKKDYEDTLEQIAKTDHVDVSWPLLRDIIRYKIDLNVQDFLSKNEDEEKTHTQPSEVTSQSSAFSLQSSSPPTPGPVPALQGIIIPPFPKRGQTKNPILRLFNSTIDEKEAGNVKQHILLQLDNFDDAPPFTIQRLCELCLWPRKHHKTVGKYLRALERVIRVTSTKPMYSPEEVEEGQQPTPTHYPESATLKIATTPVFSPIPFLHLDARRSRSPSPFELSATQHPNKLVPKEPSTSAPKGLGLVDELDDPKPGHLADQPTALTSVTKIPPLSKRFVKGPPDEDIVMQDNSNNNSNNEKESRPSEDAEVEGMVLDPEEQNK